MTDPTTPISRRRLLQGAAAGVLVIGWNPRLRSWVTAGVRGCNFEDLPPLDGVLLQDDASRTMAADDYGHVVHRKPCAVLRPGSVDDIVKIVRFARDRRIKVSMRGQGHSSFGQAQVDGGIVIDSATLSQIHLIEQDRAVVDPGVLWRTVLLATSAQGVTPPVLNSCPDLSVGGTLSLGGLDSGPMVHGAQTDNVLELEVVTGRGDLVTCSAKENTELFDAVRAGLGQCAIIVRATLRLVPMPAAALLIRLRYDDLDANLNDLAMLVRTKRFSAFDEVFGYENGRWVFDFQGAVYFTPPHVPDVGALLEGLHDDRSRRVIATIPYLAWPFRADPLIAATKGLGTRFQFVISNPVLPERTAGSFFGDILSTLTPADLGEGRILLSVGSGSPATPLLRRPDSDVSYAPSFVRIARSADQVDRFVAASRRVHDAAVAAGGKRYPWDAVPNVSRRDWIRHYDDVWPFLVRSKKHFDPANILGSGVGIFTDQDR